MMDPEAISEGRVGSEDPSGESITPGPIQPGTKDWTNSLYAVFEILLCSGIATSLLAERIFRQLGIGAQNILFSPKLTALFMLLEGIFLLSLIFLLQRLRAKSIWDLGIRVRRYWREARIGLACVPLLFLVNFLITQILRLWLPQWISQKNPLLEIIKTPTDLALFLLISLLAGGIKEEVQRAFILQRFQKYLNATIVGVVLWSAAFGAGHIVQGYDSALGAGVFGLIFGTVYLWRNSMIAPMVAHTLYDVFVLTGYWFLTVR